jgi:tetratricopeptide (TPR) repeat protein
MPRGRRRSRSERMHNHKEDLLLKRLVVLMALLLCGSLTALADASTDCNPDKDADVSIRACTALIEQNPRNALAYYNPLAYHERGSRYFVKREYAHALRDLNKAIELNPQNANSFNLRGLINDHNKDRDRAIQDFDMVIELGPPSATVWRGVYQCP